MTDTKKPREFGLLIRKLRKHGTLYVEASICSRPHGELAVHGCSDDVFTWERPKHLADLALDGLGIYGHVSDSLRDDDTGNCRYIGDTVEYRDVYAIDQRKALRFVATLKRVHRVVDKAQAFEPGDKLAALAQALKLDFVVEDRERFKHDPERRWLWLSVPEGRNRFRQLIVEAEKEETDRLGGAVRRVS